MYKIDFNCDVSPMIHYPQCETCHEIRLIHNFWNTVPQIIQTLIMFNKEVDKTKHAEYIVQNAL